MGTKNDLSMERQYWWYVLQCRRKNLVRLIETNAPQSELSEAVQGIRAAEFMSSFLKDEENNDSCISNDIIEL